MLQFYSAQPNSGRKLYSIRRKCYGLVSEAEDWPEIPIAGRLSKKNTSPEQLQDRFLHLRPVEKRVSGTDWGHCAVCCMQ